MTYEDFKDLYKNNGLSYYIDGGYKNKGKSVCDSYKIPLK